MSLRCRICGNPNIIYNTDIKLYRCGKFACPIGSLGMSKRWFDYKGLSTEEIWNVITIENNKSMEKDNKWADNSQLAQAIYTAIKGPKGTVTKERQKWK